MKAYVIKNKDGGYSYAGSSFSENLCISSGYETIEQCKKVIDYYGLQDCEIVEITIAEGDLDHQLADKDKENEVLRKALELACEETDNYWNEKKALAKKMALYDYFIEQAKIDQIEKGEKV